MKYTHTTIWLITANASPGIVKTALPQCLRAQERTRQPAARANLTSTHDPPQSKIAGIFTELRCHTSRATGITACLKNGGRHEIAQQMASNESARATCLYDRRGDEIGITEVERIAI